MKAFIAKHKLPVICIPIIIAVTVAAVIGVTQYKKAQEVKSFFEEGNRYLSELDYDRAIACYDQALKIDMKNRDVNMALADCYTATGRQDLAVDVYSALLDHHSRDAEVYNGLTELYIGMGEPELAKETMEKAAQKVNKKDIETLYILTHPHAPEFSQKSGSYSERFVLEITSENASLDIYYTLDGEEPTEASNLYTQPFVLGNGSTVVKAVTVNSMGYVSDTSVGEYTIDIADLEVEVKDEAMEDIIRDVLDIDHNTPIYNDDIESIVSLYIIGDEYIAINANDSIVFSGNQVSVNARSFSVSTRGRVKSLGDIAELPFLDTLVVAYQEDLDISALAKASKLKALSLIGNELDSTDINALSGLTGLEMLCLGYNEITDISPLSNLSGLTSLALWENDISDISAVSSLTGLTYFDISGNDVEKIDAVKNLSELVELWIYDNDITDLTPIRKLEALEVFMLRGNPIENPEIVREIYPHLTRIDENLLGLKDDE